MWVALATEAIGFGGMFAVYTYVSPLVTEVTGWPVGSVPLVLAASVSMTLGMPVGADCRPGRCGAAWYRADRLDDLAARAAAAPSGRHAGWIFLLAFTGSVTVPAMQTWLMDLAGDGQSLAASLNHSAFNVANAAGAFGGGLVIDLGFGWTSPAVLGAVLAAAGLAVIAAARLSGTNLSGSSTAGSAGR